MMRRLIAGLAALVLSLLVSACATSGAVRLGATVDEVVARQGEPFAAYQLAKGQRLLYRPQSGQVQSFDFDASGKLASMEQVLTEQRLGAIVAGQWRATDVQQTFGPPARRAADGEQGSVWTYFFQSYGTHRRARIFLDAAGVVLRVDFADDPAADLRYR